MIFNQITSFLDPILLDSVVADFPIDFVVVVDYPTGFVVAGCPIGLVHLHYLPNLGFGPILLVVVVVDLPNSDCLDFQN